MISWKILHKTVRIFTNPQASSILTLRLDKLKGKWLIKLKKNSDRKNLSIFSAVVEVPHYSYAVYRSFIRWVYTDELHIDIEDAVGLLDLANCYCENELKHRCSQFIKKVHYLTNFENII